MCVCVCVCACGSHLPLPAEHVAAQLLDVDAVAQSARVRQLDERVLDGVARAHALPAGRDSGRGSLDAVRQYKKIQTAVRGMESNLVERLGQAGGPENCCAPGFLDEELGDEVFGLVADVGERRLVEVPLRGLHLQYRVARRVLVERRDPAQPARENNVSCCCCCCFPQQ